VVVAVGHDVDRLFRQVADAWSVQRCTLQMLQVASPVSGTVHPAVLSGLSLLRYNGFRECAGLPSLRERILRERPDLISADVNLMFTQRPDGDLVIGDTHVRALTTDPFRDEATDDLILAEIADLLGLAGPTELTVRRRWQGVYAWSPSTDFLLATAHDDSIRIASVTSGIGMTTAFGFARAVLNDLAL
jgi:D-hydroxyproline dehydrogenase subunit beta